MTDPPKSRSEFIAEMRKFIQDECAEIGETLAKLSWTPDHILKSKPLVQCPHNASHFVPEGTLKKHARACELQKRGCLKEDLDLQLQDDDFFYEKAGVVGKVKIDEGLLNSIIWNHCMENGQAYTGHRPLPVNQDDACINLPRDERLAVYDYCVQQFKAQGKMANIEKDEMLTTDWEKIIKKGLLGEDGEKPKSKVELMAMLRDQKRRRQSYRAKNVHVTKKSYTEIVREVISNQTEILMASQETDSRSAEPFEAQSEYSVSRRERTGSPTNSYRSKRSRTRSRSHSPRRRSGSHDGEPQRSQTEIRHSDRDSSRDERNYGSEYRERDRKRHRYEEKRDREEVSSSYRDDDNSLVDQEDDRFDANSSDHRDSHHSRHRSKSSKKKKKHKHKKHRSRHAHSDSESDS